MKGLFIVESEETDFVKQIEPGDAAEFWKQLSEKNHVLASHLRMYVVAPGDVVAMQPRYLSDESYLEYKRALQEWLLKNDFI